jgi:hypothetical protein
LAYMCANHLQNSSPAASKSQSKYNCTLHNLLRSWVSFVHLLVACFW